MAETVGAVIEAASDEAVVAPAAPAEAADGAVVGEKRGLMNEEKPKVVLRGIGYADKKQVEKALKNAGIAFLRAKATSKMSRAVITFADEAARDAAFPRLQGLVIRGSAAVAEIAESRSLAVEGASDFKRFRQDNPGGDSGNGNGNGRGGRGHGGRGGGRGGGGRGGRGDGSPPTIEERVTPLVHVPYEAQLKRKERMLREDCCSRICRDVRADWLKRRKEHTAQFHPEERKVDFSLLEWLANVPEGRQARRQPTFPMDPIRASPQVRGYRNKCEFTIGRLRPDDPEAGPDNGGEANGSPGGGGGDGGGDGGIGESGIGGDAGKDVDIGGSSGGGAPASGGSGGGSSSGSMLGGSSGFGEVAAGFRLSNLGGSALAAVARPYGCRHVSDEMKAVCAAVEAVAAASSLGAYDVLERKGGWRQLTLRQSWKTGQLMVHVMLQLLDDQDRKTFREKDLPLLIEKLTGEGEDKDWTAKGAALTAAAEAEAAKKKAAAAAARAAAKAAEVAAAAAVGAAVRAAAAAAAVMHEEPKAADEAVAGDGGAAEAPMDGEAVLAAPRNGAAATAGEAAVQVASNASSAGTRKGKKKAAAADASAAAPSTNGVAENGGSSAHGSVSAAAAAADGAEAAAPTAEPISEEAAEAAAAAPSAAAAAAVAAAAAGAVAAAAAGAAAAANRPRAHVACICLQEYNGSSVPDASDKVEVLWGSDHIEEELCGLRFRIGPGSFFQVNTPGAEVLYATILEHADMGGMLAEAAVLDVCCGTGTIGLACAKHGAASVTGVELCIPAVEDARRNAVANGISTATFVQDKAEKAMRGIITRVEAEMAKADAAVAAAATGAAEAANAAALPSASAAVKMDVDADANGGGGSSGASNVNGAAKDGEVAAKDDAPAVVAAAGAAPAADAAAADLAPAAAVAKAPALLAIVDPPRDGLHRDTITALRQCSAITRLVYVSCNPTKSLPRDALLLCQPRSQRIRGDPFRPVRATGVDMFPHTEHAEMVMTFER